MRPDTASAFEIPSTPDLECLRRIDRSLSTLLEGDSSVSRFGRDLSDDEVTQLVLSAGETLARGEHLRPPETFLAAIGSMAEATRWKHLLRLLEVWTSATEGHVPGDLCGGELKVLAAGLLWEALLMEECRRRRIGLLAQPRRFRM